MHIKDLYFVGITFHSCGCSGPGYIPKDKNELIHYFEEIVNDYNIQLAFWRDRVEPRTEKEIQRENTRYREAISQIPFNQGLTSDVVTNEAAKKYWLDRISVIEKKIKELSFAN